MKQGRAGVGVSGRYEPKLVFTYHSLIHQLQNLLSQPHIISAMRDHKKRINRTDRKPDVKEDIQHGKIWSELVGPDGDPFFTAEGDEIGLILALDWYVIFLTIVLTYFYCSF